MHSVSRGAIAAFAVGSIALCCVCAQGAEPPQNGDPTLLLYENGLAFPLSRSGQTVGDALRAAGIAWRDADLLSPGPETLLPSVGTIFLLRERTAVLRIGTDAPRTITTYRTTVQDILTDANVHASSLDTITPQRTSPLGEGETITVTRVVEETRDEEETIPPPVRVVHDDALPLGRETVEESGAAGAAVVTVHVRTENGKEVARTVRKRVVRDEPRPRIVRRGTKLVVLGAETGRASWYRAGEQTAAHRSYPFGTRVRVVRTDTGVSTIVTVSDRGPFLSDRIIDLSEDAFRALAPLGEGVVSVRVERLP